MAALAAATAAAAAPACGSAIASALASSPRCSSSPALFFGKPVRTVLPKSGPHRFSPLPVRAATSTDDTPTSSVQAEELISDLKAKWDGIEDKSNVLIYGGGALATLWLSSTIVGAVNAVPLLPKVLELVGLAYTGWFVYKYLLFKESRKELVKDIEELKSKIAGVGRE